MSLRGAAIGMSIALSACAAGLCYLHAETLIQDEQPLTDDVSRAMLFAEHKGEMATELKAANVPFAFPSTFQFAKNAIYDENNVRRQDKCKGAPDTCPIFGVDISHYEPNFPIDGLASQKGSFVYMKTTQGTNYFDDQFGRNWKAVGNLQGSQKIPRGAYHFLSSDPAMSGKNQADSFVKFVNMNGGFKDGDLLPALDLEWDVTCQKCPDRWATRNRSPKEIVDTVHDFIAEVRAQTGRTPLIYTNKVFLAGRHVPFSSLLAGPNGKTYKVWIFDLDGQDLKVELPNPNNNLAHVLWQFSFTGKLPGYGNSFDVNVYKGTDASFKKDLMGAE